MRYDITNDHTEGPIDVSELVSLDAAVQNRLDMLRKMMKELKGIRKEVADLDTAEMKSVDELNK